MTWATAVVAIIAIVVLFSGVARRFDLSAPLLLTVAGIAVGWLPIVPPITIPAEVILLGFLPPLLYSMAIKTSLIDLKTHVRGIMLLSIGHVVVVAVGVGLLLWWQLHIPLPLALAFGGVVAPPDAVAATAIAKNIGMPKKLVTLLEGESLFNDATALVLVRMSLLALASGVTAWHVGVQFLWAAGGGLGIGVLSYWLIARVRKLTTASVDDTALSFICPWIAYLPAEALHSSGVLATVMCGVLLGHYAYTFQDAQSRLAERTTWRAIQFILENAVFFLVGLQAFGIFTRVQRSYGILAIVPLALMTLAAVIVIRGVYIFATMWLWRIPGMSRHEAVGEASILSWAGMRGVVTLAAVLSIPAAAPHRDLLVLLALVVVAGTLLLQGGTLSYVARRARLAG
ncbi:MAG: cation:proton antiporter, partial [Propionibacteriaceae bacterium]